MVCADIKNMYTELPHDVIVKSIHFMFHKIKLLRKYRKYRKISIPRSKHGKAFFGYSQNYRTYITLSFNEIISISTFDINNVYFTSLGQVLHQIKGVPMGSPGSPSYAICICMYYENQFYNSIYDIQKLSTILPSDALIIQAKRYIDDVLTFFAYDVTKPATLAIAKIFTNALKYAYHPNMKFKDVPVVNNQTLFLETQVSIHSNNLIDITHYDKNYENLVAHSKQKTLSIMNAHSFNPSSQPRNNILNTLHRINQNSSNNYNIFIATFKYMSTLFTHNYTLSHFFSALNRIGRSTNNPIWKCIKNTTSWLLQQQNQ